MFFGIETTGETPVGQKRMPYDLLIRNAQIVSPLSAFIGSVAVENGTIADIGPNLTGSAHVEINASGLTLFPGLIDSHVHFNEPGRAEWEGLSTGSSALAAGGGTTFFDMPLNSSPPVLDGETFDEKRAAGESKSFADFGIWGGLVPGNLDKMEELADCGVVGFKAFLSNSGIDEFPRADDLTLYRGMQNAKQLGLLVAVHAESEVITAALTAEAKGSGIPDYLNSRPIVAEVEAIERAIILAEETGCPLHIVHVSTSRGIELVRRAAARGTDVTCETCPHYLILNHHDVERLGPAAKCAPPLRTPEENDRLWQDLAAGRIAFIASDHSPAPSDMKTSKNFFEVWGGISGVQSTLAILLSRAPALPLPFVGQLTATAVAKRFQIPKKGSIDIGMDADFSLVDTKASFELKRDDLLDRHKLSPYVGRTFHGIIRQTIMRGETIFQGSKIVGKPRGKLIRPSRQG